MLFRTLFVCLYVLSAAKLKVTGSMEITFNVTITKTKWFVCDHDSASIKNHIYTVLEGEMITLKIKHPAYINHLSCAERYNKNNIFLPDPSGIRRHENFIKIRKDMGNIWECTILSHKDNGLIKEVVNFQNSKYSAAFCYMQIHVRPKSPPQTILVNNMSLESARTDLSEKDIDFTAVYEYADSDSVSVTCANFNNKTSGVLSLEYKYADQLSGIFKSSMLSSDLGVGFRAKLHSGHNNTELLCIYKEPKDYTKYIVKFIMRTKFDNFVSVTINGMIVRPNKKILIPPSKFDHYYTVQYRYFSYQTTILVCEIVNEFTKLAFLPPNDQDEKSVTKKQVSETRAELTLLRDYAGFELKCAAALKSNGSTIEFIDFNFTIGDKLIDPCPLYMDLPSNGTAIELYENNKLKVIYYEFEDGENLTLNCHGFCSAGPIVYLQLDDINTKYDKSLKNISKTLELTGRENTVSTCYLMDVTPKAVNVLRELRVIFLKKPMTTTIIPTTTIESSTVPVSTGLEANGADDGSMSKMIIAVVGVVTSIFIICVIIVIFKLRKRNNAQEGPHDRNYENLQSEAPIPPYPTQWEQTYAVPVDGRNQNETYSVPYRPEGDLYSIPVPKSERNKTINEDPNYASLDLKKSQSRNFLIKDMDDPTYSEVSVGRKELYAQVLPKSQRNKKDINTYSNVTNERAYANTGEPLYCDPNTALKSHAGQYMNVSNNPHYVNSAGQEYVEPTYCEPNKQ